MERIGKILAKITVAPAAVVAVLSTLAFFADTPGTALGAPSVGVGSGARLDLVGVRGEDIEFAIIDNSIGGRWASDTGIDLTLRSDDGGFQRTFQVAEPEEKNWDDNITVSQRSDHEIEIDASFELPNVPAPETQTLTGAIVGDFEYPDATGEDSFSDVSTQLNIPVTLKVVTEEAAATLRSPIEHLKSMRLLVGLPTILLCFAYIFVWASWKDRELVGKRWVVPVLIALGAGVWSLGTIMWTNKFFSE